VLSQLWRRAVHCAAIAWFRDVLGDPGVLTDSVAIEGHNRDWTNTYQGSASVVLCPSSTAQVSQILSYCNTHLIPVVPQGGNTGLVGGSIAFHQNELVLSLSKMNKILEFCPVCCPNYNATCMRASPALELP
jgi:FAD/FMN-containing dehydrogenase